MKVCVHIKVCMRVRAVLLVFECQWLAALGSICMPESRKTNEFIASNDFMYSVAVLFYFFPRFPRFVGISLCLGGVCLDKTATATPIIVNYSYILKRALLLNCFCPNFTVCSFGDKTNQINSSLALIYLQLIEYFQNVGICIYMVMAADGRNAYFRTQFVIVPFNFMSVSMWGIPFGSAECEHVSMWWSFFHPSLIVASITDIQRERERERVRAH